MSNCEICGCIGSDWCLNCSLFDGDIIRYWGMFIDEERTSYDEPESLTGRSSG